MSLIIQIDFTFYLYSGWNFNIKSPYPRKAKSMTWKAKIPSPAYVFFFFNNICIPFLLLLSQITMVGYKWKKFKLFLFWKSEPETSLSGLQSSRLQDQVFLEAQGSSISSPTLVSCGHMHSWAHGPFSVFRATGVASSNLPLIPTILPSSPTFRAPWWLC